MFTGAMTSNINRLRLQGQELPWSDFRSERQACGVTFGRDDSQESSWLMTGLAEATRSACEHKVGAVLFSQVAPDAVTSFLACGTSRDESFRCVRLRVEGEKSTP